MILKLFNNKRKDRIIDELTEQLKTERFEASKLRVRISSLEGDSIKLKELIERQKDVKSPECVRGNYCRNCVYSTVVNYGFGEKCVCTYGACPRFEDKTKSENET